MRQLIGTQICHPVARTNRRILLSMKYLTTSATVGSRCSMCGTICDHKRSLQLEYSNPVAAKTHHLPLSVGSHHSLWYQLR